MPQYGQRYHREGNDHEKAHVIGIVGGAALLAVVPLSLQWSQVGSAVPLLTLSHANAQYYGSSGRHVRRVYRRAYRRAYGYPSSYGGYPSSSARAAMVRNDPSVVEHQPDAKQVPAATTVQHTPGAFSELPTSSWQLPWGQ
jgi:hypothetical protein